LAAWMDDGFAACCASDGPSDSVRALREAALDFEWSGEEREFQVEVRDFVSNNSSPEVMDLTREGMAQLVDTPARRGFMGKLAERGWLGMSWPTTYGGGERPGVYEYLLNEELASV